MKVLYVINGLGTGGAERSLAEMLPRLGSYDIDPIVVCLHHRQDGVEREVLSAGFDVRFATGGWHQWLQQLPPIIREVHPALVHTSIFESDIVGRLSGFWTGTPVVTSLVNTSYVNERLADPHVSRRRLAAARQLDRFTSLRLTRGFHALSTAVADHAIKMLGVPAPSVTVIPRGRDADRLGSPGLARRKEVRRKLGLSQDDEVVVTVGRQEFQKDHLSLFQALDLLAPTRPQLRLLHAGRTGHATQGLDAFLTSRPQLARHVQRLGHRDDVPDLLAAADVFVFPSRYEGLGGALIEAMALGLPIVASDLPAVREVVDVGGNAALVPVGRPELIAKALADVLGDSALRTRWSQQSRVRFETHFSLEKVVQRMAAWTMSMSSPSGEGS